MVSVNRKAVTLSTREMIVAERYATGATHKQIAAALSIAPATVRNHLAAVYRKLGVSNKPELIRALAERAPDGLVLPPLEVNAPTVRVLRMLDEHALPPTVGASVAVMPFVNIGPAEGEHFSHGVTTNIHNDLTRFPDLFVSGRSSCLAVSKESHNARELAGRLGVQYVVQGTVRTDEERVRITAELVDGRTGRVLWSERFDRVVNDLFEVESEVADAIAGSLSMKIGSAQYERRKALPPDRLTAYDWVLRGNRSLEFGGRESLNESRRCFERALGLEPGFAAAYAGLSLSYGYECDQLLAKDYWESLERHRELAEKAIALDESDSRAHYAMVCALALSGEFELADRHAARALELNPSEYHNICNRGYTLMSLGRLEESVACFSEALRRNPHAPNSCLLALGLIEYLETNYGQCATALSRMTARCIQRPSGLAAAYAQLGYAKSAHAAAQECRQMAEELPGGPITTDEQAWHAFWQRAFPYLKREAFEHLLDGIEKAGLPV